MKTHLKMILTGMCLIALVFAGAFMAGCTEEDDEPEARTITIVGSTTVLPIAEKAAEAWMNDHPDDTITVTGGGSSVGVKGAADGTADIGMASREMKDSEKSENPDIVKNVVAKDGIGIILHKDNKVDGLTLEQVKKIYLGEITNWNEVGGDDMAIEVVGRDSASGTRATFDELVLDKEDPVDTMKQKASNGAVHDTVETTEAAIGYVGLGYMDEKVKACKVDGIAASEATVLDNSYPISRDLNMFTKGAPTGLAKEFLDYIKSPAGQAIVAEEGFVKVA